MVGDQKQSASVSSADASSGRVAEIRDILSTELKEKWSLDWPVYWQNMPNPNSMGHSGYLQVSMKIDSVSTLGGGRQFSYLQGVLLVTLAVKKGQGMDEMDQAIDFMASHFSQRSIEDLRLGAMTFGRSFDENGFYLSRMQTRFSCLCQRPVLPH